MKCNSDYHAGICPARKRNGDCISKYPCRHKVEPPKPKTNADHIRSMTDEELAVFIADKIPHGDCCDCYLECAVFDHSKFNNCCHNAFYKWLKQPYNEDT